MVVLSPAMKLSPQIEAKLHELCSVFLEENAKVNLSAFRTDEACFIGNVLDSVAALDHPLFEKENLKILDIGTGGGFPLLPLAICKPNSTFVGLDSVQKKIDAIGRIADTLNLSNVTLICGRTEDYGHKPEFREQFDIVTARAVAELPVLLEYTSPFVKVKGCSVLWKSMKIDEELQDSLLARAEFSSHLTERHTYELPGDWGKRQLLFFEKGHTLHTKYPRDVGIPKKDPII